MKRNRKPWHATIVKFATHVFTATMLFCILSIPAYGLHVLVHWMEMHQMQPYPIFLLNLLEYALITIDVAVVLLYSLNVLKEELWGNDDEDD